MLSPAILSAIAIARRDRIDAAAIRAQDRGEPVAMPHGPLWSGFWLISEGYTDDESSWGERYFGLPLSEIREIYERAGPEVRAEGIESGRRYVFEGRQPLFAALTEELQAAA